MRNENNKVNEDKAQANPANKVAFVLSGGGNRGVLEVGVLLALLQHGIRQRTPLPWRALVNERPAFTVAI